MAESRRRFPQEFKDELCLEVISTSKSIKDVATAYGVGPETLRNWLKKYRENSGGTEAERSQLDRVLNTNRHLRRELSRTLQMFDDQRAVTKRVTRTEQDLAHAHELLAGQGADVHQGHQSLTEVHADAVELARMDVLSVALTFFVTGCSGNDGTDSPDEGSTTTSATTGKGVSTVAAPNASTNKYEHKIHTRLIGNLDGGH